MKRYSSSLAGSAIAAIGFAAFVSACDEKPSGNLVLPISNPGFTVTPLVADIASFGAKTIDANVVNPWGIVFGATGNLWVANNGTGTSTVYDANGNKQAITVGIPTPTSATGGTPTGIISNATSDFAIGTSGPSLFIFASEDGVISAWNAAATNAQIVADRSSSNSVYKGIAMASNAGANFVYATDFHNGKIDMFDKTFAFVKSFTDPNIPAGFAPFGIANIGGKLYVSYAKQLAPDNEDDEAGAGNGFIDIFNADGTLASRFVSNGNLNSPWAMVVAPAGFGSFSGALLVGNFGDGRIGAYDVNSGSFRGTLNDLNNIPLVIDGLWGLTFGPASGSTTLYFASGPNDEAHGLVGTITPR
jgi:uncharacterized protein (TIGR03118 family)